MYEDFLGNLFGFLGLGYFVEVEVSHHLQVAHHVLGYLHTFLSMLKSFLVSVQLGEKGADLHVDFALVLQLLQLLGRVA